MQFHASYFKLKFLWYWRNEIIYMMYKLKVLIISLLIVCAVPAGLYAMLEFEIFRSNFAVGLYIILWGVGLPIIAVIINGKRRKKSGEDKNDATSSK